MFPFVSNAIVDEEGLLIGENKLPVFVDFMRRDTEHLSSNMIVLGRPGSGKSYACKSIIAQLASCNTRVFILDPESEYGKLAKSMGGKVLDVSSGKFGKINPFQIIRTENDENKDGTSNDYFSHLQFLEEFYRVVLPGINSDSLELLNRLTQELFSRAGITPYSDLNGISEEEYPTFDDLGKLIDDKIERETDEYNRGCLKVLTNYIARLQIIYPGGGRVDNETYKRLRENGFVFSRTNGAFQRQLNENSRYAVRRFIQSQRNIVEQMSTKKETDAEM